MEVAGKLGSGEMQLGLLLDISSDRIGGLRRDNKGSYHELVHSILETWNKAFEGPMGEKENKLCAAFSQMGRNDIAKFIKNR